MKKISLIIPCYNEEDSIKLLYTSITDTIDQYVRYKWEVLFINDGSTDATLEIIQYLSAKDKRVSYIDLSRNFGKERAMLAGFDYARGDCAIILDADLQDPPTLIPTMIEYWEQGYDDVYAKRKSRGKESLFRKMMSLMYYKLLNKATKYKILENVGDFRLLDRKCINALRELRESDRYTKGLFCWIGFKKKELLFDRGNRDKGNSHWGLAQLLELAIEGIVSFTMLPLRISAIMGFISAFIAFILMLFYLIKTLIYGDSVRGFTTLVVVILFFSGVILMSIGILGEYVGRIFDETKKRPVYIIREYVSHE
jgi:glycosyltransferase involved in cell wall biosynthesis